MQARMLIVLACLAVVTLTLPFHGCGDNDNSGGAPCCPVCGDGVCSGDEGTCDCPQDCIGGGVICPQIVPVCGDGFCERAASPGESHENCAADCPLECRECAVSLDVWVNHRISPGSKCPPGTTLAYRHGNTLVCHACEPNGICESGHRCGAACGPGAVDDDASSCFPIRVCEP